MSATQPATNRPTRRSTTKRSSATKKRRKTTSSSSKNSGKSGYQAKKEVRLLKRAQELLDEEVDFIANDSFVGRRDRTDTLSDLIRRVELGEGDNCGPLSAGLPAHLGRLCATPLLTPEQEQECFERMNFCKYRLHALKSRLSRSKPDQAKLREAEDYRQRAERLRNYIIQANTRLVMSIARKFADGRNGFDDLLSQGVASLMHAIEKFDYSRGYRFSTYATCAVRRDLYRMVMGRKKDHQRFTTGSSEFLTGCADEQRDPDELTESGWNNLSQSLSDMLQTLDDREQFIVTYRFGLDESGKRSSYSRLGERLGISKERVRQLANRALEKLREQAPEYRLEGLLS